MSGMRTLISLGLLVLISGFSHGRQGVGPGSEDWGYVDVRTGAHIFYWLFESLAPNPQNLPLVIWLQGGPGASSIQYGLFEEIGIFDWDLNIRTTSWVNKVNVLFVDNPVGTGFSYVDSQSLFTTTNEEIGADLVTFLKGFLKKNPAYSTNPLWVFCESYGGKMTIEFAKQLNKAIQAGDVDANFKGVALGDSWISPIDSVLTWAPFLLSTGVVDQDGYESINRAALQTKAAVDANKWTSATNYWGQTENVVLDVSNGVDFYNILTKTSGNYLMKKRKNKSFCVGLCRRNEQPQRASDILAPGGTVRNIIGDEIPEDFIFGEQSGYVFSYLSEDFMKPVTSVVEEVLNTTNLKVVVFTGQLDLIVDTPGTVDWVERLQWKGKQQWDSSARNPLNVDGILEGYVKESGNFALYWINRSGHMVPEDNPQAGLEMLRKVTNYDKL